MRGIDDLETRGRTVLLRCDLNVPLDGGHITDDGRIRASLPTITALASRGARVVIIAHLGRPAGADYAERSAGGPSLLGVAARLGELIGAPVTFAADVAGPAAAAAAGALAGGQVALLENVRFEPGETSGDDAARGALAARLATLAGPDGAYVDDAFGAVHRKHASVYDLPRLLPAAAGQLVLAEAAVLRKLTTDPGRPYVVVLGGAKVSDKLGVIGNLLGAADRLLVGGGMAFTFLAALGQPVGRSLLEPDLIPQVSDLMERAPAAGTEIVLPADVVVAPAVSSGAPHRVVPVSGIPDDEVGVDIGPQTAAAFAAELDGARTVFWNGPMGVAEIPAFAAGTRAVAEALSRATGLTVVGGGDSAAAVRALGFPDSAFGHISTGGGASLEYLEGRTLPGLAVLEQVA